MRKSTKCELHLLNGLNRRAEDLINTTRLTVSYSQERVQNGINRVQRVRAYGFGAEKVTLRPPKNAPSFVDAQIFDTPSDASALNELADGCSVCGSHANPLVALVRFESLGVDLAVCAECYQALSDRALGQVA